MDTPEATSRALAGAVAEALAEAGITQREASRLTAIPLTTLSRRLTGHSPFTVLELAALASVTSTTVSILAQRAEHVGDAA